MPERKRIQKCLLFFSSGPSKPLASWLDDDDDTVLLLTIIMGHLAEKGQDNKQPEEESSNKKRSRPETAALQLLELAGSGRQTTAAAKKRLKSIVLPTTRSRQATKESPTCNEDSSSSRRHSSQEEIEVIMTRNTTPPVGGQFDDASSSADENDKKQAENEKGDILPTETAANNDGQFDDASETDTPHVEFFSNTQQESRAWKNESSKSTDANFASWQIQPLPREQLQVPVPPPLYPKPPDTTNTAAGAATSVSYWGAAFQPIAPRFLAVAPTTTINTNTTTAANIPIPIVPRLFAAVPPPPAKQFKDEPLKNTHPNPILLPDARIDDSARLRPMPAISAAPAMDTTNAVYKPLPTDILSGRGGRSNQHAGNAWFRDFIAAYRPSYAKLEKFNKMQLATNLVNYVRHCGGRFLQKKKTTSTGQEAWFEIGDVAAIQKCSQCLREQTKSSSTMTTTPGASKATATAHSSTSASGSSTGATTTTTNNNKKKKGKSNKRSAKAAAAKKATVAPNATANSSSGTTRMGTKQRATSFRRSSNDSSTIATHATDDADKDEPTELQQDVTAQDECDSSEQEFLEI